MSLVRLSEHTKFSKVCRFKNSFLGSERKDRRKISYSQKKDFLFAKKARAQFASFYIHASLHASFLHAQLARKQIFLFL